MSKIDELLDSIWFYDPFSDQTYHTCDIERIMKEYAEYYAKKCLKIADSHIFPDTYCAEIYPMDITLPPHE